MTPIVPDLLRRFVPTLHGDTILCHSHAICVESNDAAFATELSNYLREQSADSYLQTINHIKVVIEPVITSNGEELTDVDADSLRVLLRGTNTMLLYDSESRELLVFLAQDVSCREFCERLLPALTRNKLHSAIDDRIFAELQTSDNDSIVR